MIGKRSLLFGAVMLLCAAQAFGQISSSPSSALSPPSPYTGSVSQGKATQEVLKIGFADAIERGLKYNLGLLLAEQGITSARGERWKQLSEVLPNLTTNTTETASKINLEQNGFTKIRVPNSPFTGISPIAGPFGFFDTRAYVSTSLVDWSAIQKVRSASESLRASQFFVQERARAGGSHCRLQLFALHHRGFARGNCRGATEDRRSALQPGFDRLTAGTSPQIDALRAKVEFQTRQQQLIAARNDYEKQRLAFARTIGLPPGQAFELTEKIPYDKPGPMSVEAAVAAEPTRRAPIFRRRKRRSAPRNSPAARPWPNISRRFRLTRITARVARRHRILDGTYQAQGSLKIPIFQGGKVRADTLQADANLTNSRNQLENLRGQIDQDVRDAILDMQSAARAGGSGAEQRGSGRTDARSGARPFRRRRHRQHRSGAGARRGSRRE